MSDLWIIPIAGLGALLLLAVLLLGVNAFARTVGALLALALTVYIVSLYPLKTTRTYYESLLTLPWIPAQEITLASGKTVVGFDLSDSNVSMEFLINGTRSVVYYPNQLIKHQKICDLDPEAEQGPLIRLIPAKTTVPLCPAPATVHDNLPAPRVQPAGPASPVRSALPVTG